jgi:hypothetical protein
MAYWVLDANGHLVAVVPENDPDMQRVLLRAQRPVPTVAPPVQQPVAAPASSRTLPQAPSWSPQVATQWAPTATRTAPRRQKDETGVIYRVKHVPTGRFLGTGLDPNEDKTPKVWSKLGDARNAVSHAVRRRLASANEYEIVPMAVAEN